MSHPQQFYPPAEAGYAPAHPALYQTRPVPDPAGFYPPPHLYYQAPQFTVGSSAPYPPPPHSYALPAGWYNHYQRLPRFPIYLLKRKVDSKALRAVAGAMGDDGTHWALEVNGHQYHITVDESSGIRIPRRDPIPIPEHKLLKQKNNQLDDLANDFDEDGTLLPAEVREAQRIDPHRKTVGETYLVHEQIVEICT